MIAGLCSEPFVLEIMRIVNTLIGLLKIAVPLILIVIIMINVGKGIVEGEEELNKAIKGSISKLIAAILIFFVPTIVVSVFKLTLPNSEFLDCLTVKTKEDISKVYVSRIEEYIRRASESLSVEDYDSAKGLLTRIKDDMKKQEYSEKLSQIEDAIYVNEIERFIAKAEQTLDDNDYLSAYEYLNNIKDETKRTEYANRLALVKEQIDEINRKKMFASTGLGKDIEAKEELIEACRWVLNQDKVNIRLHTCTNEEYRYTNPEKELPGGAVELSAGNANAKETITLAEYQKGVFFGEERVDVSQDSRNAYMIIYRTVFVHNTVHYAIRAKRDPLSPGTEITYTAGSCAQNYRNSQRVSKYESGKNKKEIDDTVEQTKYLVVANDTGNSAGETTDVRYHSYTGIEQQIEAAGKNGTNYVKIIEEVIKSGNDDAHFYKNARVYDCRNLLENGKLKMN
jgi:hypothetical protein